jgi:hypothetical protein
MAVWRRREPRFLVDARISTPLDQQNSKRRAGRSRE